MYSTLEIERNGRVATVWMNRPDVHNAFDETLIAEITAACEALDAEVADSVRERDEMRREQLRRLLERLLPLIERLQGQGMPGVTPIASQETPPLGRALDLIKTILVPGADGTPYVAASQAAGIGAEPKDEVLHRERLVAAAGRARTATGRIAVAAPRQAVERFADGLNQCQALHRLDQRLPSLLKWRQGVLEPRGQRRLVLTQRVQDGLVLPQRPLQPVAHAQLQPAVGPQAALLLLRGAWAARDAAARNSLGLIRTAADYANEVPRYVGHLAGGLENLVAGGTNNILQALAHNGFGMRGKSRRDGTVDGSLESDAGSDRRVAGQTVDGIE
mgnify:CR=1 FL=1